jgi:hypothetical protein
MAKSRGLFSPLNTVVSVLVLLFSDISLIFPVSDSDQNISLPSQEYTSPAKISKQLRKLRLLLMTTYIKKIAKHIAITESLTRTSQ